ncbi:uncharacterized protein PAC_09261 [Phialocephala subalpina]|uniref:Protein NO VEIN C-terminal domain-containing protein n=1 Tax=Phialocephala subalpina TaxID=576137 RepID=A0A1L7X2W2_9HELO|nr:uncharacterized protein PAC_09261 [Phialocephala subalpina]
MGAQEPEWEELGGREAAEKHIQEIRISHGQGGQSVPGKLVEILEQSCKILANQLYEGPTHFLLELIQNANDNKFDEKDPTMIFTHKNGALQVQCNEVGFSPANVVSICGLGSSSKKNKKRPEDSIIYVGEKGIGFKSVFRVADVVWVSSRAYSFKFDSEAPLGMITPAVERFPVSKLQNWTSFYLRLKKDRDGSSLEPKIRAELETFDERLLLFLQRLRTIKIQIYDDFGGMKSFQYNKYEIVWDGDQTINLADGKTTTSYLTRRHKLTALPKEDRREGVSSSEVVLAFPVNQSKEPIIVHQRVFAFLPIQDFGFSVILQADFLLTANREGVETSNPWNETLRNGFINAFEEAATNFNQTSLQYKWIRYLPEPSNSTGFFEILKRGIRDALVVKPVLRAWDEKPLRPDMALIIPEKFRDQDGRPLTLNPKKEHTYLSKNYSDADFKYLKYLGVKEMTHNDFLTDLGLLLKEYFGDFTKKTSEWQSRLAGVLTNILLDHPIECLAGFPLVELRTGKWVSVSPDAEKAFFPGERDRKVPGGIEMQIVDPKAAQDPARRQLYSKLGVADIENTVVQERIVQLHESWKTHPSISTYDLIAQIQFLFSTLWVNNENSPIWIVTEQGQAAKGSEVYIDSDGPLSASKVFAENRAGFNFIHPKYLAAHKENQDSWIQWIIRNVGVSEIPRLVLNNAPSTLSKDFRFIIKSSLSERWLHILCVHWAEYEVWLKAKEVEAETTEPSGGNVPAKAIETPTDQDRLVSELRDTMVTCRDKKQYRLHETYLPLDEFIYASSGKGPLLRIKDAENTRWQNLGLFGVGVKNDFKFYLHWLGTLAGSPAVKRSEVNNLLRQIQARCRKEDEEEVKKLFVDSTKKLIFVPDPKPPKPISSNEPTNKSLLSLLEGSTRRQGLGPSSVEERQSPTPAQLARIRDTADDDDECKIQKGKWYLAAQFLWSGPHYFRVNRSLNSLYPGNERLFRDILGLTKVDISHFIAEVSSFSLEDPTLNQPLAYMWSILAALNSYMSSHHYYGYLYYYSEAYYQQFLSLKTWPILTNPDDPPKEMRTAASSDEWFIADRWDLKEIFCETVPLLAFDPDLCSGLKIVFRSLSLEGRYLSTATKTTTKFEGRIKLSPQYTERLRTKAPFLIRIVNSDASSAKPRRLAALQDIEVYLVDKIVKRNTVRYQGADVDGKLSPTDAYVERENDKLKIYVVSSYLESDKTLDELVTSLGSALEITSKDWLRLFQFVLGNDNEEKICTFLDKENIPRNPNAKEDYDWGTEEKTIYSGSGGGGGGGRGSSLFFRVISSDNFHEFSSSFPMAGGNGVWFMPTDNSSNAAEISEKLAALGFQVVLPGSGASRQMGGGAWGAPEEEEEDETLQFLGEHELSLKLEQCLEGLYVPEEHWTSPLRTQAGLPEYKTTDGKYGAAFTIPDDPDHRFAKIMAQQYGQNIQSIYNRPPKNWHLEVKPSYGTLADEFSLNWEQFERIRKLSYTRRGSTQGMPTEASVLVRVYNVGKNSQVTFLVEPWKLYTEDKIEFRYQGTVKGQPVNTE